MNFDLSDELQMLRDTARDFLAERSATARARALYDDGLAFDQSLWDEVAAMGWLGVSVPEEHGGSAMGAGALAVLAEEAGRSLAPIPLVSTSLAADAIARNGSSTMISAWLPRLACGEVIGAIGLSANGSVPKVTGNKASGSIPLVADGLAAHILVVELEANGQPQLALIDMAAPGVARQPRPSVDPARPVADIHLDAVSVDLLPDAGRLEIERLRDSAAILMGFEQLGVAEAALTQAREQVMERYAFGRPIASFQAVKHRLADMWVKIELARSCAYFGVWAMEAGAADLPVAAACLRLSASDAATFAVEENVHLHGGVGYTWEYDCHLLYRRARVLRSLIGNPASWEDRLATGLTLRNAA